MRGESGREHGAGTPDHSIQIGHRFLELAIVDVWPLERPRPGTGRRGGAVTLRTGAIPASPNRRRAERWLTSTTISSFTNASSISVADLIDMPMDCARVVAEISGAAASARLSVQF